MAQIDDRMLDVNEYGVLRIPPSLWLAFVFMARHWVLGFFVLISSILNQETLRVLGGDFSWVVLAIEAPALLLLWLCTRRRPDAGRLVRALWPYARHLAVGNALLHIGYVVWYLWHSSYWLPWPELFLVSCALIDVAILVSLYQVEPVRQALSEFPAPPHSRS